MPNNVNIVELRAQIEEIARALADADGAHPDEWFCYEATARRAYAVIRPMVLREAIAEIDKSEGDIQYALFRILFLIPKEPTNAK